MRTRYKVALFLLFIALAATLLVFVTKGANWGVLNPKGSIALQERHLMGIAAILMLVVAIPVFAMTLGIAWKYREGNKKAKYTPDWDHNVVAETVWWGIPCIIIIILATITWRSTHALDPSKAIASDKTPIQVVALDWKWLFIYPNEHIATVNYIAIPKDTPINFEITADAPMNSFWIPQLGGQIYAMAGMTTQLHLMATENGTYTGSSANISGKGFAGMKFDVQSVDRADYDKWITDVRTSGRPVLTQTAYNALAEPSENTPHTFFSSVGTQIYHDTVMKFMSPSDSMPGMTMNEMMAMPGVTTEHK
jgi:cytochrome o ubiquinol oxidase subunit 2